MIFCDLHYYLRSKHWVWPKIYERAERIPLAMFDPCDSNMCICVCVSVVRASRGTICI